MGYAGLQVYTSRPSANADCRSGAASRHDLTEYRYLFVRRTGQPLARRALASAASSVRLAIPSLA